MILLVHIMQERTTVRNPIEQPFTRIIEHPFDTLLTKSGPNQKLQNLWAFTPDWMGRGWSVVGGI
jgi:hypothetical protein